MTKSNRNPLSVTGFRALFPGLLTAPILSVLMPAAIIPAALISAALLWAQPSQADVISPSIDREQEVYSSELPNAAFFGRGISGRMSEASHLRFNGEQFLLERRYKDAYRVLSKAVQLDSGDPTGHVLLARSMTGLLRKADGTYDEDMLNRVVKEWKMIAYHDADISEQFEAKAQLRKLGKIVKALKKEKLEKKELEQKELEQKEQVAAKAGAGPQ